MGDGNDWDGIRDGIGIAPTIVREWFGAKKFC